MPFKTQNSKRKNATSTLNKEKENNSLHTQYLMRKRKNATSKLKIVNDIALY
jgi:hypothetical protein